MRKLGKSFVEESWKRHGEIKCTTKIYWNTPTWKMNYLVSSTKENPYSSGDLVQRKKLEYVLTTRILEGVREMWRSKEIMHDSVASLNEKLSEMIGSARGKGQWIDMATNNTLPGLLEDYFVWGLLMFACSLK